MITIFLSFLFSFSLSLSSVLSLHSLYTLFVQYMPISMHPIPPITPHHRHNCWRFVFSYLSFSLSFHLSLSVGLSFSLCFSLLSSASFSRHSLLFRTLASVPTMSVPNWQTLISGVSPETHGRLGNEDYDGISRKQINNTIAANTINNTNHNTRWRWHTQARKHNTYGL